MRTLVVTFGSFADPRGGTQVRTRATVEALRRLGHDVSAICVMHSYGSYHEPAGSGADRATQKYANDAGLSELLILNEPVVYGWSVRLASAIRRLAPGGQLIVLENALLFPAARSAARRSAVVWDTNECQSLHYARLQSTLPNRLRQIAFRGFEYYAARQSDVAVAIGSDEARWWRHLYPQLRNRTRVVEHRPYLPPGDGCQPWRPPTASSKDTVLVFLGNVTAKQNATAARWLLDVLAPMLGRDTHLVLAGVGTDRLRTAAEGSRTWCLGEIRDIGNVIAGADLCLAPLAAGAGVKTKVLHYLALGRPVLGTPAAFEGIHDAPGATSVPLKHLAAAIPETVRQARADPRLSTRQREWFAAGYGADVIARQWEAVVEQALRSWTERSRRLVNRY